MVASKHDQLVVVILELSEDFFYQLRIFDELKKLTTLTECAGNARSSSI